jgi:hypothetical protein
MSLHKELAFETERCQHLAARDDVRTMADGFYLLN